MDQVVQLTELYELMMCGSALSMQLKHSNVVCDSHCPPHVSYVSEKKKSIVVGSLLWPSVLTTPPDSLFSPVHH